MTSYSVYLKKKQALLDKLIFKNSCIGYALNCDLLFTSRVNFPPRKDYISNITNNSSIYISLTEWPRNSDILNINELVKLLSSKNIKVNFYILQEPVTPMSIINLLNPVSNKIFITNNIYNSPKIKFMSIGIRDCATVVPMTKGFTHNYLFDEGKISITKNILCLMCFTLQTHPIRKIIYDNLADKNFITNLNNRTWPSQPSIHCGKVPIWSFYDYLHKSIYCLSPRGCGVSTHRFWESLYLDTIPIVVKTNTNFDKFYEFFPCLLVDSWDNITEELLESKKDELQKSLKDFKTKHSDKFMTDVNYINDLLDKIN